MPSDRVSHKLSGPEREELKCGGMMSEHALLYIEELEERAEQAERDRDALLGLLENIWEWSDARGTINEVEWRKRLMPRIEAALTKTGRLKGE